MATEFLVYLAGPIKGLTYLQATDWRDYVVRAFDGICPQVKCLSPMRCQGFRSIESELDADLSTSPLSTSQGITARDRFDVSRADLILFNLVDTPDSFSAGTCIEIGWADSFRKPMIAAMTPGSVWDHGMIRTMIPFTVPTLDEAIELVPRILLPERIRSAYQVN